MREALGSWHIGRVITAYRYHPWHGRVLPQELVANWAGIDQARLSRIENRDAIQDLGKLIEWARMLGIPPELLWFKLPGATDQPGNDWQSTSEPPLPRQTAKAATESLAFAHEAALLGDADDALEHLHLEIGRIAVAYVHAPISTVFDDLIDTRNTVFALLAEPHRPRGTAELYVVAGATCLLLAHASQNLGDQRAALAQLRAAWTCAEVADHDALRAWSRGTAALINEWSLHQRKAVELAGTGAQFAASAESKRRLLAISARAAARMGNHDRALTALSALDKAIDASDDTDDVVRFGGLLSFPAAKQAYYVGSTYSLLGDHEQAERHATTAIAAYEAGPPAARSYGDEGLARLDVVSARLARGNLEGASEALAPVLALPPERRIQQFSTALGRTRQLLRQPNLVKAPQAVALIQGLDHFDGTLARPPELPSSR
jgi:tetratricopeptide (TPR) repeat protein